MSEINTIKQSLDYIQGAGGKVSILSDDPTYAEDVFIVRLDFDNYCIGELFNRARTNFKNIRNCLDCFCLAIRRHRVT